MKKIMMVAALLAGFYMAPKGMLVPDAYAAGANSTDLISSGTSCNLVASGAGSFFNIVIASGTAADYAVCYDSASCTGITTTLNGSIAVPEVARVFVTAANTTTALPASQPVVNFTNGLACIQSATQRTKIYWRQPS